MVSSARDISLGTVLSIRLSERRARERGSERERGREGERERGREAEREGGREGERERD